MMSAEFGEDDVTKGYEAPDGTVWDSFEEWLVIYVTTELVVRSEDVRTEADRIRDSVTEGNRLEEEDIEALRATFDEVEALIEPVRMVSAIAANRGHDDSGGKTRAGREELVSAAENLAGAIDEDH